MTEAIRLDPNNAEFYLMRGLSYTYSGNFEKAIEDYNQAIRLSPNYADAYMLRSLNLFLSGVKEMRKDIEKAIPLYQQQGKVSQAKALEAKVKELDNIFNMMMTGMRK